MRFSFECPSCGGTLEADSSLSGGQAVCAGCGGPVAVPEGRAEPGTTIGEFRLERRLGKGGMGEVFLAHQFSVDRKVAVKILPSGFAENEVAVRRFLQEGRLAARLDHAHIATVYEAGEDSGTYYLAMAYVEGESLDRRIRRDGALPEAEAIAIVRAVAEALAYAWETFRIIHRDIKPANIMVDARQRVFLMDLGLAKSLGQESGVTLSGTILGTPQYMSPEQARGQADLGVASDIYSLGATLYHLATGTPPFDGDSVPTLLHKHVYEALPPPRERNPALSEGCARLIERMMAKRPEDRHGDWRELLREIDRMLAGEEPQAELSAVTSIAPERGEAAAQASLARHARQALARQRQSGPAARAPGGRHLRALAAAAAVLLAVVICAVARVRQRDRRADVQSPGIREAASSLAASRSEVPPARPVGGASPSLAPSPRQLPSSALGSRAGVGGPAPGQDWTVPGVGMEFVWVGSMGLWVGKYEVTNGEYRHMDPEHRSRPHAGQTLGRDRQPAAFVDWDDVRSYAVWLTNRERQAGRLSAGTRFRLPTEDEFMAYAQCGDGRTYPWGDEWPPPKEGVGNYSGEESIWRLPGKSEYYQLQGYRDGFPVACDVEDSWRNPWGIYGVGGNVWEMCATDTIPRQSFGALRGAAWSALTPSALSCAFRWEPDKLPPRVSGFGFRLVLASD